MITVSSLIHSYRGCSPPSPQGSFTYDCSCFLTFVRSSQASFILATLQIFLVNFTASCCSVKTTLPDPSCNFRGFMLHRQHAHFPDPSYNFSGFMHDFSLGLSCSCHSLVLHCQHGYSVKSLVNLLSFCQLSSDYFTRSTTPRILHAFTILFSSCVHTF